MVAGLTAISAMAWEETQVRHGRPKVESSNLEWWQRCGRLGGRVACGARARR